jgi:L-2-hydroxyglutarate oxidase LhgO
MDPAGNGRPRRNEKVSATFMDIGTDVNFGSLTSILINELRSKNQALT